MLNIDYIDKAGNKWSIDQGDWMSPQIKVDTNKKSVFRKGFMFFVLTLGLLAFYVISLF